MHGRLLRRLHREATEERCERTVRSERVLSLRPLLALTGVVIVVGLLVIRAIGSRDLGYNTDVHDRWAVLLHHGAEIREHGIGIAGGGGRYNGSRLRNSRR